MTRDVFAAGFLLFLLLLAVTLGFERLSVGAVGHAELCGDERSGDKRSNPRYAL